MSRPAPEFYLRLDVPVDASIDAVAKAYRQQTLSCHPDRLLGLPPDQAAERLATFQWCREAYETLIDPQRRAAYDTMNGVNFHMRISEIADLLRDSQESARAAVKRQRDAASMADKEDIQQAFESIDRGGDGSDTDDEYEPAPGGIASSSSGIACKLCGVAVHTLNDVVIPFQVRRSSLRSKWGLQCRQVARPDTTQSYLVALDPPIGSSAAADGDADSNNASYLPVSTADDGQPVVIVSADTHPVSSVATLTKAIGSKVSTVLALCVPRVSVVSFSFDGSDDSWAVYLSSFCADSTTLRQGDRSAGTRLVVRAPTPLQVFHSLFAVRSTMRVALRTPASQTLNMLWHAAVAAAVEPPHWIADENEIARLLQEGAPGSAHGPLCSLALVQHVTNKRLLSITLKQLSDASGSDDCTARPLLSSRIFQRVEDVAVFLDEAQETLMDRAHVHSCSVGGSFDTVVVELALCP